MTATGNPIVRSEFNARAELRSMAKRRYLALSAEKPRTVLSPAEYARRAVKILSEVSDTRATRNWRTSRVEIR